MSLEVLREVADANRQALEDEIERLGDQLDPDKTREGIDADVWRSLQ